MELELAERKLGCLELNGEWTEVESKESEGFIDAGLSESSDKEVCIIHFIIVHLNALKEKSQIITQNHT